VGGSGYGFGYPASGYWLGGTGLFLSPMDGLATGIRISARFGYEVRTLLAAATILARTGRQQPCVDTLVAAADVYKTYVSDLKKLNVPVADASKWADRQIAAAKPRVRADLADAIRPTAWNGIPERHQRTARERRRPDPRSGHRQDRLPRDREGRPVRDRRDLRAGAMAPLQSDAEARPPGPRSDQGAMEDAPHVDYGFTSSKTSAEQDRNADLYWKKQLNRAGE
jgi:hypothetical protein